MAKKHKNKKGLGFEGVAKVKDTDMLEINIDIDEELKDLENHFCGITLDDRGVDELLEDLDKGSKKLFEHLKVTVIVEITLKCVSGEIETKKKLKKLFKSRLGKLVYSEKNDELVKIYENYKNSDDFDDTIDQLFKLVKTENKDELEEVFFITSLEKKKHGDKNTEEKKEENKKENKPDEEYQSPFGLKFRTIEDFGIKPIPFKRKRVERTKLPC